MEALPKETRLDIYRFMRGYFRNQKRFKSDIELKKRTYEKISFTVEDCNEGICSLLDDIFNPYHNVEFNVAYSVGSFTIFKILPELKSIKDKNPSEKYWGISNENRVKELTRIINEMENWFLHFK